MGAENEPHSLMKSAANSAVCCSLVLLMQSMSVLKNHLTGTCESAPIVHFIWTKLSAFNDTEKLPR